MKRKNSVNGKGQLKMARLINAAQNNEEIKVIFIHGGLFYNSGNDLSALAEMGSTDDEELKINASSLGVEHLMVQCLLAINRSKKPVVGLCRG